MNRNFQAFLRSHSKQGVIMQISKTKGLRALNSKALLISLQFSCQHFQFILFLTYILICIYQNLQVSTSEPVKQYSVQMNGPLSKIVEDRSIYYFTVKLQSLSTNLFSCLKALRNQPQNSSTSNIFKSPWYFF